MKTRILTPSTVRIMLAARISNLLVIQDLLGSRGMIRYLLTATIHRITSPLRGHRSVPVRRPPEDL
jgi:hypothetical protein